MAFTATQFGLLSAAAAIVGRFVTGTTAGGLIVQMGYVNFYLLTTLLALPGVALFAWMMKAGLVDASIAENDVRRAAEHTGKGCPGGASVGVVDRERSMAGETRPAPDRPAPHPVPHTPAH